MTKKQPNKMINSILIVALNTIIYVYVCNITHKNSFQNHRCKNVIKKNAITLKDY